MEYNQPTFRKNPLRTPHRYAGVIAIFVLTAAVLTYQACSESGIQIGNSSLASLSRTANIYACDPFMSQTPITTCTSDAENGKGLVGPVFVEPTSEFANNQPGWGSLFDFFNQGTLENFDVYFSALDIPPGGYTSGFYLSDGTPVLDDAGKNLTAGFALSLTGNFHLAPTDKPGSYELALLSDDGSTMEVLDSHNNWIPEIGNDGFHGAKFGCSAGALSLTQQTLLPIKVDYFQGPGFLALQMYYRPASSTPEALCGQQEGFNNILFYSTTAPYSAGPAMQTLAADGWKVVTQDNFN